MKRFSLTALAIAASLLLANIVPLRANILPTGITAYVPVSAIHTPVRLAAPAAPVHIAAVEPNTYVPQLDSFVASVENGQPNEVVGVYVPGLFALPVLQQPLNQPGFVAVIDNTVTQFAATEWYGTIGLLAHNFLGGRYFYELAQNQAVIIVYGDGHQQDYRVTDIQSYQALNPESTFSNFVNLNDPTHTLISANDLFNRVYTTANQVVFQTCINANGDPSWGRIFITATKIQ